MELGKKLLHPHFKCDMGSMLPTVFLSISSQVFFAEHREYSNHCLWLDINIVLVLRKKHCEGNRHLVQLPFIILADSQNMVQPCVLSHAQTWFSHASSPMPKHGSAMRPFLCPKMQFYLAVHHFLQ